MTQNKFILILVATLVISACTEKTDTTPIQTQTTTTLGMKTQPAVKSTEFSKDIPSGIKGAPFELGGKCAVDSINKPQRFETIAIKRADGFTMDGWAFVENNNLIPPAAVLQLVDGEQRFYAVLSRHGGREDLSKEFGSERFAQSGLSVSADIASLPLAQYDVLIIQNVDGKNLVCPTYRKLVVSE